MPEATILWGMSWWWRLLFRVGLGRSLFTLCAHWFPKRYRIVRVSDLPIGRGQTRTATYMDDTGRISDA